MEFHGGGTRAGGFVRVLLSCKAPVVDIPCRARVPSARGDLRVVEVQPSLVRAGHGPHVHSPHSRHGRFRPHHLSLPPPCHPVLLCILLAGRASGDGCERTPENATNRYGFEFWILTLCLR